MRIALHREPIKKLLQPFPACFTAGLTVVLGRRGRLFSRVHAGKEIGRK